MLKPLDENASNAFRAAVDAARPLDSAHRELEAIYERLESEIATHRPRCDRSGRCCRFDEYGHVLFVTTIETAYFFEKLDPDVRTESGPCPYQIGGLCSVHGVRPFGCRVFFCDPAWTDRQYAVHEAAHQELRALHDRFGVECFYLEWRQVLQALGVAAGGQVCTPLRVIRPGSGASPKAGRFDSRRGSV